MFGALRRTGVPMRRMSTAASAGAPAPTPLVTSGTAIGGLLGLYVGALGVRVVQARNGTLPDDLDGPLATLTAAKAIKKFCTPARPVATPPAAASAAHSHDEKSAAVVAALEGAPPAGSPEELEIIAGLQNICDRLGRVQVETTSRA